MRAVVAGLLGLGLVRWLLRRWIARAIRPSFVTCDFELFQFAISHSSS